MIRSVRTARGFRNHQNPRRRGGLGARQRSERQMPRRNSLISRLRDGRAWDEWDEKGDDETEPPVAAAEVPKRRPRPRRVAAALTFAALFIAGAAFSATAGDQVRSTLEDSAMPGQASTDATMTEPSTSTSAD